MRLAASPERLLDALADAAPRVLTRFYTPNCCLDATALACEIAALWGVKARPELVNVRAFNKEYLAGSRKVGEACVLLIDCESEEDIAGHLVCTGKVGSHKFLLDLSAFQFDRPEKGISVPAGVFMCSPVLFGRKQKGARWQVSGGLPRGAAIVYEPHPHPESVRWREAAAWTAPLPTHQRVRLAARAMLLDEVERILRAPKDGYPWPCP